MNCKLLMTTPSSVRSSSRLSGVTGALYNLAGNSRNPSASFGNRCKVRSIYLSSILISGSKAHKKVKHSTKQHVNDRDGQENNKNILHTCKSVHFGVFFASFWGKKMLSSPVFLLGFVHSPLSGIDAFAGPPDLWPINNHRFWWRAFPILR